MEKNQAKERISKLRDMINKHVYLYHVLDKPEISDQAFDALMEELIRLESDFPEFVTQDSPTQRVGAKPLKEFKKFRHPERMFSFNDAFDFEDMQEWQKRIDRIEPSIAKDGFYCELKIDGLAIELIYGKGILVTGSTRGDGITGEDVTQNLKTIKAIPLKLASEKDLSKNLKEEKISRLKDNLLKALETTLVIRGEAFLSKDEFQKVNAEQEKAGMKIYANPRNLAAGSIRQLDSKITMARRLDSFAYSLKTDIGQVTHEEEHLALKALGFKINSHNKFCKDLNEVEKFKQNWEKERENLEYEIDGIVVIVNNNKAFEKLDYVGRAPRGAIAYKFAPLEAQTKVNDIIVNVGRTGILTPVALLEPVKIGGVTVSRATLHNLDEIRRLEIKIGDTVIVGRAGDVIPDVKSVFKELRTGKEKDFQMPKKCPVCGEPVQKIEGQVAYKCVSKECPAIKREAIYHFVSKRAFNMEGIGPKIIDQLMAAALIKDSADLFSLTKGDLLNLERFADKSAQNAIDSIQSRKEISFDRFIYSLGIDHVGEETAFVLAKRFNNLKDLETTTLEQLQNINDIGPVVAQSIFDWFQKPYNKKLIGKLVKEVKITEERSQTSKKLSGKTFVLTGTLESLSRDQAKDLIREMGGEISSSVSKNIDYVVAGSEPGSKYDKAQDLGVKILDEGEFLKLVK